MLKICKEEMYRLGRLAIAEARLRLRDMEKEYENLLPATG